MKHLIVGTAGHIDHGKTTLIRTLTGVDTDRLVEERERGITIDLGFTALDLGDRLTLGVIDVPGHEAFVRNMVAGATGIDLALIVVAADEGAMPQTHEHLAILELLGVRTGIIALTKTDLVDDEWLELVTMDLQDSLAGTPFAEAPIIPLSSATGEGVETLRAEIRKAAENAGVRRGDDLFRLPIDRAFSVHGTGTVVTGTVWSGQIEKGAEIEILPLGHTSRVRTIQVHGEEVERARAGERAALGLVGVERSSIRRGDTVLANREWRSTRILDLELRLIEGAETSLQVGTRVRFHLGTAEVMGRVYPLEGSKIEPGERALAQIRLEGPAIARAGDHFVIRSYSPVTTIGGGTILVPWAGRRGRLRREDEVQRLRARIDNDPLSALTSIANDSRWEGVPLAELPILTPLSPTEIEALLPRGLERDFDPLTEPLVRIRELVFTTEILPEGERSIIERVEAYHQEHPLRPGIDRTLVRRTLPKRTAPALVESLIEWLVGKGVLEEEGPLLRLAGFRPSLDERQRVIHESIIDLLEEGGLTPPELSSWPEELRSDPDLMELIRLLEGEGTIIELRPEIYILSAQFEEVTRKVREHFQDRGPLRAQEFREAIPVSRKFLIPILERLDMQGITRRVDDHRVVL